MADYNRSRSAKGRAQGRQPDRRQAARSYDRQTTRGQASRTQASRGRTYDRQSPRGQASRSQTANQRRKRPRKRRFLLRLIFRVLLLVILLLLLAILYLVSKLETIENHELEHVAVNTYSDKNMSDYRQIAIFGVDSRANELTKNTRSDSIMIASINEKTHDVKLISVYRDTYVKIDDHDYTKVNHAYAYGGPDLAVNTLNKNFDLNISDFVTINFSALSHVIDSLGGIELTITKEERKWVNAYAKDVAKINGEKYTKIKKAGKQTVTGVQATGYCRVRYTKGGDYTRAERQRTVVNAIFEKAKHSNPITLINTMNEIFPQIYTSLTTTEILDLVKFLPFYEIAAQEGFPYEQESHRAADGIYYDFPVTLHTNVVQLHEKLFGTTDFSPSDTVEQISNEIASRRGG